MEGAKLEVKFLYPNCENYSEPSFSGQVHLQCSIKNIAMVTETALLVSPPEMIRGVPFILTVRRIGEKTKNVKTVKTAKIRTKVDKLRFSLVVNDNYKKEWNCRFLVVFRANDANTSQQFGNKFDVIFKDTWSSLHHDTRFDVVSGLSTFLFDVMIVAGIPSNWTSVKATNYIGLRNEGATCYINSVLQLLFQITRFREIVFDAPFDEDDVDFCFVFALKYIFYLMQNIRLSEVRTKKLIDRFNWQQMTTSAQQDVHEFVRRLIEELDKYLQGTKYAIFLSELFVGQTKTTTACKGIQSTTHHDVFWDLSLPVNKNDDIQKAIESYMNPGEIDDYNGSQYKAIQKREFTVLPPVLCFSLLRFRFDVKSQQIIKNNELFEFGVQLDLNKYIPGSSYTLHSILVHSGTMNAGHYTVFTNPKCDNSWYKFDDTVVTKCLESNAIEKNFGNRGDTNAYMLIYIKNADIPLVLNSVDRPIPFAHTIEAVIRKEQEMIELRKHQIEFIVYTPERMGSIKFKRDGKLFETRNKHSFIKLFIDCSKSVKSLYELLFESLRVNKNTTLIRIWKLSSKGEIDDWKQAQVIDPLTPLKNNFNHSRHSRNCLFMQSESVVQNDELPDSSNSEDERVMIFFKHYDANSNSITFFECSFFEAIDGMDKVYDYIRKELHLNRNVPLKVYRDGRDGRDGGTGILRILLKEDQLVYSAIADDQYIAGIASARSGPVTTLVFEIGQNGVD